MCLFKYKILAFVVLFKKHRRNSLWFKEDSFTTIAKKLGLSYNTVKKYYTYCVSNKIIVPYGEHLQFVKFTKILQILDLDITKYCIFFKWKYYKELSFKEIYKTILYEKVLLNFKHQNHEINKKKKIISRIIRIENSKKTHPKTIKSILKRFGSISKAKRSISKNYKSRIRTGKNHLSNIIGCSPMTALSILKKMDKDKIIERTVIFERTEIPYTFTGYDELKNSQNHLIVPSPRKKCFFLSKGSIIVYPVKKNIGE
jgi:DNA-binding Lrp family transcriptional regulator